MSDPDYAVRLNDNEVITARFISCLLYALLLQARGHYAGE